MVSTATQAVTLERDAFARLVTEEKLEVVELGGYKYAGKRGKNGWEVYRSSVKRRYFWTFRQVCTEDGAGGGNVTFTLTPAAGTAIRLISGRFAASGNRALYVVVRNEDGDTCHSVSTLGAVAAATATWPTVAGSAGTSGSLQDSKDLLIPNPCYMLGQVTACAQTETATLTIWAEIIGPKTAPTVVWASSGTPNAAAATDNEIHEVDTE